MSSMALAATSAGRHFCSTIERSRLTKRPPLKPAIGVLSCSGSNSMSMPRGGRPLVMAKRMPTSPRRRTAACARSVSTLSSVTRVPSTSASTSEILSAPGARSPRVRVWPSGSATLAIRRFAPTLDQVSRSGALSCGGPACVLEDVDERAVAPSDLGHRLFPGRLVRPPRDQRIPEVGAADGEADEARHARGDLKPFAHFLVVLAPPEDDAADLVASAGPSGGDDRFAIPSPIEALDLPD